MSIRQRHETLHRRKIDEVVYFDVVTPNRYLPRMHQNQPSRMIRGTGASEPAANMMTMFHRACYRERSSHRRHQ